MTPNERFRLVQESMRCSLEGLDPEFRRRVEANGRQIVERYGLLQTHPPERQQTGSRLRTYVRRAISTLRRQVCWHTMKRTTVKLPDEVDAKLRHEADRRGMTISELTREAIETHLAPKRKLAAAGAGRSGRTDTSERIEEILASEVTPSPL